MPVTPAAEIGYRREEVELPESGPSGKMTVAIRVLSAPELLAILGGFADMGGGEEATLPREMARILAKSEGPLVAVAREVLVDPAFSFEQREEGKAFWGDLAWPNKVAIFTAAQRLAGLNVEVKEGSDAEAARRTARFPAHAEGARVRARSGKPRKAAR